MARAMRVFAVLLLSMLFISPLLSVPARSQQNVIHVLNYSEYIDYRVLDLFEKETGIHVVYDEYESAEEAWPKLKAGGQGYDLIIIAHTHVAVAREQGLLHKLDKDRIPNLANLDPRIANHPADPNQEYAVPYMWGTTGFAYNKECGGSPPRTWKEFFDPEVLKQYKGRVSLLSEFSDVVEPAMIALGLDPSDKANWNKETADSIVNLVLSVKPYIVGFYGASQYMPELAAGRLCLAQAWNGDILVVQENNSNIEYVVPEDGATFWVDYMVIPRDAGNVAGAEEFINFLLRPDIAAMNVKAVWYASSVKKSLLQEVAEENHDDELEEILENPTVYPPNNAKLYPSPVLTGNMLNLLEDIRLKVLTGETSGGESGGGLSPAYIAALASAVIVVLSVSLYIRRR